VRHLVDLHGGSVAAHSDGPGKGATMVVDIPVVHTNAAERVEFAASDGGAESEGSAPLEGLDVLVVEDDPGAAEMLSVVLSDRGARVRTAIDYASALRALEQQWPDALISDIGLPGPDGYELIRAVRGMTPPAGSSARLASVALTAFARPEDRERALDAGFDAHVPKPLKPHALVKAVLAVVGQKKKPA
jgi:CheY-like chemotaxis protein